MKKKLLLIVIPIIIVLILVFFLIINPKLKYKKDISILEKKITLVNNYLVNNTGDIKVIKEELKKESVSKNRLEIEKEVNRYLTGVINNYINLKELDKDNKVNHIFDDNKLKDNLDSNIKYLNDIKNNLTSIKENIKEYQEINIKNIKDEDNIKDIKELFNKYFKIDNYQKVINEYDNNIDNTIKELEYLKNNKNTWSLEDDKIIFNKRSNFNEYEKIGHLKNFELVKDTTSPVITASDITITKGTSLDVKNKVKCEDAVDGKVECKIDGSYDINKTGSYSIKITATDESNNTSNKTIKVIVKEKEVNNKPYYIEVIRNQNIVLVYGLDSNGNYTKLVKTFIASVGNPITKTPLGTFKTSDKASWGWLVGNIYGQYFTRIHGDILFHSVPYEKKNKYSLEWEEYNKLGTPASKGCIRMTVRDVKWIYDNCPRGTTVKIYDGNIPKGVSKPTIQKISADSPNKGWDPTDPDKNNPWRKG